jgi:hypothetical protein
MTHWLTTRLARLIATCYAGAMQRAIDALPNDDLEAF